LPRKTASQRRGKSLIWSKSGSLTKIKFQDRYFAVTTEHQIRIPGYEYKQLCLINDDAIKLLTSHAAYFIVENEESRHGSDIVIFEYTNVVLSGSLSSHGWYDLSKELHSDRLQKPDMVCGLGYPGHRNQIDYENSSYAIAPNAIWGVETEPNIEGRLAFKPTYSIDYAPDGMSGGPVFGLELLDAYPSIFFAGILTNASSSVLHFLSRTRLSRMIDESIIQGKARPIS